MEEDVPPLLEQEYLDVQLMDEDDFLYVPTETPTASVAGDENPDDAEEARVEAEITRRLKARRLASRRLELARIRTEDEKGIAPAEDITTESCKQRLALETGKEHARPGHLLGRNPTCA